MGSTDGTFWKYDGVKLYKFCDTKIQNFGLFKVHAMAGRSSSDIYAVGFADSSDSKSYKGIIMHFDGKSWTQVKIPTIKESFKQIYYVKETDEFIVGSWVFGKPDCYAYRFNGKDLTQIYHFPNSSTQCMIGDKVYFTDASKIYRYEKGSVTAILEFSKFYFVGNAWGRSEKDFFTVCEDGLAHYNGTDLQTVFKKWNYDLVFNCGIVFEDEVFFIWEDTNTRKTLTIHGVLKKQEG